MNPLAEAPLCRFEELPDGGARGFVVPNLDGPPLRVIALRDGDRVQAFRNRCPHRGTPLDLRPDDFLDSEGRHLVCATHGALFRKSDGRCLAGPCVGDALERLFVAVEDGVVVVALPEPED